MSGRIEGLIVVLEKDMHEDDANALANAIEHMRGVAAVCQQTAEPFSPAAHRARLALSQRLMAMAVEVLK